MKWWKQGLIGMLIVMVVLLGGITFLICTTTGLHLVLNSAARWIPGFDIQQVNGNWRNLTIKGIKYEMPSVTVNIGEFNLAVQLNHMQNTRICINYLTLKDINVVVDSKKVIPTISPWHKEEIGVGKISTHYPLILKKLALHNINFKIDDTAIAIADFTSGINWQGRQLTMMPTYLKGLLITLPKTTKVVSEQFIQPKVQQAVAEKKSFGETLTKFFSKPLLPDLPEFVLPLNIDVQQFLGEQLHITGNGNIDIAITRLLLKMKTENNLLNLENLNVDSPQGQLNAVGQTTLNGKWPMKFNLYGRLNIDLIKGENIKMKLDGDLQDSLQLILNLSGPVCAQINANTRLKEVGLPFNMTLQSQQLRWPLDSTAQYQAENFNFSFSGKATDYVLSLKTALRGQDIPPSTLVLDAKGNVKQFKLDKLHLTALQGNTNLTAIVNWSKAISWRSQLTFSSLNTEKEYPDWPAKLDGKITTLGSIYDGNWQICIPELKLKGNVKNNAISADGALCGNSYSQWKIPGIKLILGRNKIDLKGSLGDNLNLDAIIDAPHLDNTLPGLGGVAKGTISVRGNLKTPQLLVNLTATKLRWQAVRIGRIGLEGDVSTGEQSKGKLSLRIEQLKGKDSLAIGLLIFYASGTEKYHQLKLNVQGEPVSGQLALSGSFNRTSQRWQGNLNKTRFTTPFGEWRLTHTIALDYLHSQRTVKIPSHCWWNPSAELCVPQTIEVGPSGHASIVLNHFDLAIIKPFVPVTTQFTGIFNGDADVSWSADGALPTGRLSLKSNNVKITQDLQGNMLPIAFEALNFNAALKNGHAQLEWLIRISHNGQLDGNMQIATPQDKHNLYGNINITHISLAMLNPAFTQNGKITGIMNSNLRLGGNLKKPQLFGQFRICDVGIDGSVMPIDLTKANFSMKFNGMSSTLKGLIQTSQGRINLSGDADWKKLDAWHARVAAKGTRIRVNTPPMVRMDVSPDLVFEATPKIFNLNGQLDVPWARISVQEIPKSSVGVSSDEVILDKDLKPIAPKSTAMPINSNLIIHVGNDVHFDAFGLKAKLIGDLRLVQNKHGLGLNGQIKIPSGRFHAYFQDLLVRKGELQFSGPPDQPYVNIEAIRNPEATEDSVTAGVRVTGIVDEPKIEIFSDPVLSQQEALSYLLRGQGLSASSSSDSGALTSALVGLGVAQSGQFVGKIGEILGVSNLALDTAGVGDSQQVQVSSYVLPGLQVKYGVGIFDSLATLTLRYRLMTKLYLEVVSGIDQALDVLYQFEF